MDIRIFKWEPDFTRTTIRLALPIAIQSMVMALMHILDNVMIGMLGEVELAGVTQANKITFLLQIIMFGLVSGCSIFSSQYWGKRDIKGIRQMMVLSLMTAMVIAVIVALASLFMPHQIMALLIKDEAAAAFGASYLRIMAIVYLMDALILVEEAVLKSTERVNLPTISGIVAIVTNTLFNYLLIFGKLGFPRLGVRGGAIATCIGVFLQLMIILVVSYKKKYPNALGIRELRLPSREIVVKYYKTVAPVVLNETLWSLGVVMYSAAYGRMGASAVAAMSIFSNIEQIGFVFIRGVTTACTIMVGKAIGAGLPDDAKLYAKRFLWFNIMIGAFMGLVNLAVSGPIISLFNVSPETAAATRNIIMIYAMFTWLTGGNNTQIVGIMRAGGDVVFSGVLDVIFLWLVSVPLVFLTGPYLGWPVQYVYMMQLADSLLKFIVGFFRVRSGKWLHNLVED